jgi:hypothetical protein
VYPDLDPNQDLDPHPSIFVILLQRQQKTCVLVTNQDPSDQYVFGPPGFGFESISKMYGSGSFYLNQIIKTLNKQKNSFLKKFLVGIL